MKRRCIIATLVVLVTMITLIFPQNVNAEEYNNEVVEETLGSDSDIINGVLISISGVGIVAMIMFSILTITNMLTLSDSDISNSGEESESSDEVTKERENSKDEHLYNTKKATNVVRFKDN